MQVLSTTQRLLRLQELIELGYPFEEWEIQMVQAMIERRNMGISFTALQQKKIVDIHLKYREIGYASEVGRMDVVGDTVGNDRPECGSELVAVGADDRLPPAV